MKDLLQLPVRRARFNANSLLHSGLLAVLLVFHACAIYVAVVGAVLLGSGATFMPDTATPWWLNLLAFALIAATFIPVARLLHRRIADLVYAEYDNPWAVVSRMAQPLQIMAEPAQDLPLFAATIAAEMRLPAVVIEGHPMGFPGQESVRASFGQPPRNAQTVSLPILHQGQQFGALHVSTRGAGRPLTAHDRTLLEEIARRLGILFHTIALNATLQSMREQLVLAREEERRRIRNDLHDGLAPTLAALQLHLAALKPLLVSDPAQAAVRLDGLLEELRATAASIRQLVYELRPPLLDELGLVGALRALRLGGALDYHVTAPETMPRLPAAVEVAAFRIVSEAVHNVVCHANATCCTVALQIADRALLVDVQDDGSGLESGSMPGVGIHSMRERAAELGGSLEISTGADRGTLLRARLPLGGAP